MKLFSILKSTYKEWMAKDPFRESAVIAYYAIFSLPGLFVLIITLAGIFFGKEAINEHVLEQISASIGEKSAEQVQEIIQNQQSQNQKTTIWGAIVGVVTLILGATGVFAQFQKSLNVIWDVEPDTSKSGILRLLRVRLFSFGLIVTIAFLLIVSLLASTLLAAFGDWLAERFSETILITLKILNLVVPLFILTLLFALMLKFFPDAKIRWKDVWSGAFVTALLFTLGKAALSLYFSKVDPGSAFGAAGSLILILLWVSYTSMIVFFGAEFTHQYALDRNGDVEPSDYAKRKHKEKHTGITIITKSLY